MKNYTKRLTATLAFLSLFSCQKDDEVITTPTNTITAPATYEFKRDGQSTVSYGGQTARLKMAGELQSALLDNTKSADQIQAMFNHQQGQNNFSDADLNNSDKNLRSKVAASLDYFSSNSVQANLIRQDFDQWIKNQATNVFPYWSQTAERGKAGNLQQLSGTVRWMNSQGLEYDQIVAKSLIGSVLMDQMVNNYLSAAKLDAGTNRTDNDNGITNGKPYTAMEHFWDEAFGYVYGAEADITNPTYKADGFINKYLGNIDRNPAFNGIAFEIYNAFKLGRAAIVAKDYALRDQQAEILKEKLSKVIAIMAVYYLESGKATLNSDKASAFHSLSEGYGFIYSLQFTRQPNSTLPYFSRDEVEGFLAKFKEGNGLWDITPETLTQLSNTISSKFGFQASQTVN